MKKYTTEKKQQTKPVVEAAPVAIARSYSAKRKLLETETAKDRWKAKEAQISKQIGVPIELTILGEKSFSIGYEGDKPEIAEKIKKFFGSVVTWRPGSFEFDQMSDYTCGYFDVNSNEAALDPNHLPSAGPAEEDAVSTTSSIEHLDVLADTKTIPAGCRDSLATVKEWLIKNNIDILNSGTVGDGSVYISLIEDSYDIKIRRNGKITVHGTEVADETAFVAAVKAINANETKEITTNKGRADYNYKKANDAAKFLKSDKLSAEEKAQAQKRFDHFTKLGDHYSSLPANESKELPWDPSTDQIVKAIDKLDDTKATKLYNAAYPDKPNSDIKVMKTLLNAYYTGNPGKAASALNITESKLQLPKQFTEKLAKQAESGMGYQIVEVTMNDGSILKNRKVLNSSVLMLEENETIKESDISDIKVVKESYDKNDEFEVKLVNTIAAGKPKDLGDAELARIFGSNGFQLRCAKLLVEEGLTMEDLPQSTTSVKEAAERFIEVTGVVKDKTGAVVPVGTYKLTKTEEKLYVFTGDNGTFSINWWDYERVLKSGAVKHSYSSDSSEAKGKTPLPTGTKVVLIGDIGKGISPEYRKQYPYPEFYGKIEYWYDGGTAADGRLHYQVTVHDKNDKQIARASLYDDQLKPIDDSSESADEYKQGDEVLWSTDNKYGHLSGRGGYIEKIENGTAQINMHDNANDESAWIPVPVENLPAKTKVTEAKEVNIDLLKQLFPVDSKVQYTTYPAKEPETGTVIGYIEPNQIEIVDSMSNQLSLEYRPEEDNIKSVNEAEDVIDIKHWGDGISNTKQYELDTKALREWISGCKQCGKPTELDFSRSRRQQLGNVYQSLCQCKVCGGYVVFDEGQVKNRLYDMYIKGEIGLKKQYIDEADENNPRMTACGILSGGGVTQMEKKGFEFVKGELVRGSDLYYELVGELSGGKAHQLLGTGITIQKKKVTEALVINPDEGDMTFNSKNTAISSGTELTKPQNHSISTYNDKFIVTTNNRANEFAKVDKSFKILGKFNASGGYSDHTSESKVNETPGDPANKNQTEPEDKDVKRVTDI